MMARRRMWALTHVQRQALLDHRDHDPRPMSVNGVLPW
jgi:hypothetical protein